MDLTAPPWLVEFMKHVSLWDAFLWLVFAIGVVWFIKKRGWRWLISFARAILATAEVIDNVKDLPEFIKRTDEWREQQTKQIADIHHEVHYNDGSSVKDGVRRIEKAVAETGTRISDVEAKVDRLSTADIQLSGQIIHVDPAPNEGEQA